MLNIAFYVSGHATRLRQILDKKLKVVQATKLVISDSLNNADLAPILNHYSISFHCLDYLSLHKNPLVRREIFSQKLLEYFDKSNIDYCFCFGQHILTNKLLSKYENKIINFHPSILPLFPGNNAIDQAVHNNCSLLGNTAHFINNDLDGGPIIMQNVVSSHIFEQEGYAGILDKQINMLDFIYTILESDRLRIKDNNVYIKGANYEQSVFFPIIDT